MKAAPPQVSSLLIQAHRAFEEGDYREALKQYRKAEKILKGSPAALAAVKIESGWCFYQLKDFSKAIHCFQQALQEKSLSALQRFDCLRLWGFSLQAMGNHAEAIKQLQQALQETVEEEQKRFVYFELGKLYFLEGQFGDARVHFLAAQALFHEEDPDYRQSCTYYLGFIAYYQRKIAQARKYFNHYIENSTRPADQAAGYLGLAYLFSHQGEAVALQDTCEKIMAVDPDFSDKESLAYFLCKSFMAQRKWEELELFLGELTSHYPQGRYAFAYPVFELALVQQKPPSSNLHP